MATISGKDFYIDYSIYNESIREFEVEGIDHLYDLELLSSVLYNYVQRPHKTAIYKNFKDKSKEEIIELLR